MKAKNCLTSDYQLFKRNSIIEHVSPFVCILLKEHCFLILCSELGSACVWSVTVEHRTCIKVDKIMTNGMHFIRILAVSMFSSFGSLIVLFTVKGQG
jgi:hypothetical protein